MKQLLQLKLGVLLQVDLSHIFLYNPTSGFALIPHAVTILLLLPLLWLSTATAN